MEKNKEIFDITDYVGRLRFGYKKFNQVASASIIKSKTTLLVATAAHCAYDWERKQYYDKILFFPYFWKNKRKYKVVAVAIPKIWVELAAVEFDTCFLIMEEQFEKDCDGNLYGICPKFDLPIEQNYIIGGSRLFPFLKTPYVTTSMSFPDKYQNSSLLGIKCKRAVAMSGGPWITYHDGEYVQNSMTSLSMRHAKNVLWGPYWGSTIKKAYEAAESQQENDEIIIHYFNF